jgi:hypothetical protein
MKLAVEMGSVCYDIYHGFRHLNSVAVGDTQHGDLISQHPFL